LRIFMAQLYSLAPSLAVTSTDRVHSSFRVVGDEGFFNLFHEPFLKVAMFCRAKRFMARELHSFTCPGLSGGRHAALLTQSEGEYRC